MNFKLNYDQTDVLQEDKDRRCSRLQVPDQGDGLMDWIEDRMNCARCCAMPILLLRESAFFQLRSPDSIRKLVRGYATV